MTCDHGNPAGACYSCDYAAADRGEHNAVVGLALTAILVVGAIVAVLVAGCGGSYPLEPAPDAGADAGPSVPNCAPAGNLIAHGCDDPLHPGCVQCGQEDPLGNWIGTLAACHPFGHADEVCAARCAECAP